MPVEDRYRMAVDRLTRRFIYDEDRLFPDVITRELASTKGSSGFSALESEGRLIESLESLLRGIEAHERANVLFYGAWQASLIRQDARAGHVPMPPERLSRADVAREFSAFRFKDELLRAELSALQWYQKLLDILETLPSRAIRITDNISIDVTDIETLIVDVQTRAVERMEDDVRRKQHLAALDAQYAEIIDRIEEDGHGKRSEIEEIYLLRRLIHAADTGHLASVGHGAPRDDLRADRGSVDVVVTAAGDVIELQMKTYKRGVSHVTRAKQEEREAHARQKLSGSQTHLAVLEQELVHEAYGASLRQRGGAMATKADKYAAFEPFIDGLSPKERQKLLFLAGLTEEDLVRERQEFDRRQDARRDFEAELERKRAEERSREAAIEAKKRAEEAHAAAELERKRATEAKRQREIQEASLARDQARAEAARAKQAEVEANLKSAQQRDIERKEEEARQKALEEKKEKARLAREAKKAETPDWPPKSLAGIVNAVVLKRIGLLPESWQNDVKTLMAAKAEFYELFADAKSGKVLGEKSKPNRMFAQAFPEKGSLSNPTGEDFARWRELGLTKKDSLVA